MTLFHQVVHFIQVALPDEAEGAIASIIPPGAKVEGSTSNVSQLTITCSPTNQLVIYIRYINTIIV